MNRTSITPPPGGANYKLAKTPADSAKPSSERLDKPCYREVNRGGNQPVATSVLSALAFPVALTSHCLAACTPAAAAPRLVPAAIAAESTQAAVDQVGAVTAAGEVSDGALAILEELSQVLDSPLPPSDVRRDPATWIAFAKRYLQRPYNTERVGQQARDFYTTLLNGIPPATQQSIKAHLASMGAFKTISPSVPATYDTLLVQGTTVQGMRLRVQSLAREVRSGKVKLSSGGKVIFLEGQRKLFSSETIEDMADLSNGSHNPAWTAPAVWPTDEREAAKLIWEQTDLPPMLRAAKIFFTDTQARPGNERAHTVDCVKDWADAVQRGALPYPSEVLMVSEAPFIEYQMLSTRLMLTNAALKVKSMASMGDYDEARYANYDDVQKLGVLLDNLAATLMRANALREAGGF